MVNFYYKQSLGVYNQLFCLILRVIYAIDFEYFNFPVIIPIVILLENLKVYLSNTVANTYLLLSVLFVWHIPDKWFTTYISTYIQVTTKLHFSRKGNYNLSTFVVLTSTSPLIKTRHIANLYAFHSTANSSVFRNYLSY